MKEESKTASWLLLGPDEEMLHFCQRPHIPTSLVCPPICNFFSPFQVILTGSVCVTQFLLSCKGRKSCCKIRFDALSHCLFFFFWVGILQCVMAKTKLPKAKQKKRITEKEKKCHEEKHKGKLWAEIVQSWFSVFFLSRWINFSQFHRVYLDVLKALKNYL